MRLPFLKRTASWLPAVFVLTVVLVSGSRLIVLSAQQHAERAREAARAKATLVASTIESQLQALCDRASVQALGTSADLSVGTPSQSSARNTFWLAADGTALPAGGSASSLADSIASEWASARPGASLVSRSLLGPMREGSQWILAARVPTQPRAALGGAPSARAAVVYADLDQMLAAAHLGGVVDAGYDFAVGQFEPTGKRLRVFASSSAEVLAAPVVRAVRLPVGFTAAIDGSYLEVAMRPRAGWYPAADIATQIGLLVVVAWLLGFGTHDLTHSLQRSRANLAAARARLHTMNGRLSSEIEQRQELQKSFDHARYHDGFTGLPNRRYFMNQLDQALRDVRTRRRQYIGVVLVDIARFRLINDTLGHTAGDELMVQVARRFERAAAPHECVLARWDGDQIALLVLDIHSREEVATLAASLQASLTDPLELRRHRLSITAHIGLTSVDARPQRAEDVLREADIALTVARKQEASRPVAYVADMAGHAATLVSLEADLHLALAKNELRLLFQPIVALSSFRMVGAEALLRWRHPVEGLLTPDKFLPIAEEAGLMVPITHRIVQRVCALAAEWRQRLPRGQEFYLSINLCAAVLRDPGFCERVAGALQQARLPASVLKFELTEAALISNVGVAREVLERLHAMGIQLMLDDFGTGYSSLNYLQLFPLDFIKIDRPVVNRAGMDHANSGMTSAMLQMAPSLGLTAIAEIVETEAAATSLRQMGCEFGQGYYFSEPVAAEIALHCMRDQPFTALLSGAASASSPTSVATLAGTSAAASSDSENDSPTLVMQAEFDVENDETLVMQAEFDVESEDESTNVEAERGATQAGWKPARPKRAG